MNNSYRRVRFWHRNILMACILCIFGAPCVKAEDTPHILLPKYKLSADEVAVVVNDLSPLSVKIGEYYQQQRKIPAGNVIHVRIPPKKAVLSPKEFSQFKSTLQAGLPQNIQAYALTWMMPYRVGCMSLTSALALGYDPAFCENQGCRKNASLSPYFNSQSPAPYSSHQMRPAVMLAAKNWKQAKALIDRGVAADETYPTGTAYLVSTSDKNRNVRAAQYAQVQQLLGRFVDMQIVETDGIENKDDVLFYFTGLAQVPHLKTLQFKPGALADHLTSAGGVLPGSKQMSALAWLEAGATGSYGAVVEPCNYPQKFPLPGIVIERYLQGETLLEAYWKSVAWPKEGVFIGEPLAAPYSGQQVRIDGEQLVLETHALKPGLYQVLTSASALGPFNKRNIALRVLPGQRQFRFPLLNARVYKLARMQ